MNFEKQCDSNKYFTISNISKEKMEKAGLTMTVAELRNLARQRPHLTQIFTGSDTDETKRQLVKVYAYADFIADNEKCRKIEITPAKTIIEEIMKFHNWSKIEFADFYNLELSQVSRWLSGKTSPRAETYTLLKNERDILLKSKAI